MKIRKRLSVTIFLKKEVKKSEKFKERDEYRRHGALFGHVLIHPENDISERYKYDFTTDEPIPEELVPFVDEIVWYSGSIAHDGIAFQEKPILPEGIHRGEKGEIVVIKVKHWPQKRFSGKFEIKISAKDMQSLIDIYAKLWPEDVLPEFNIK